MVSASFGLAISSSFILFSYICLLTSFEGSVTSTVPRGEKKPLQKHCHQNKPEYKHQAWESHFELLVRAVQQTIKTIQSEAHS